jgi:UDP-N-acetylmuramate dehydrogenase
MDSRSPKIKVPKIQGSILLDEPMSMHTSFRIGGTADFYATAKDISDLQTLLRWASEVSLPVFVIGAGTNLLVSDKGIRGMVLGLGSGFEQVYVSECTVKAGASARLARIIRKSLGRGLCGLEGLAGIPGTVGGAVCMNAGTPASCVKDILESVKAVDLSGKVREIPAGELGLTYRGSGIWGSGLIITEATFELQPRNLNEVNDIISSVMSKRRRTQPAGVGTAGSVFKNPPGGFAGQMLDLAGAKGMQVGGARVSSRHANFIENTGSASAEDVQELMSRLQELVMKKFGVALEPEIELVGEWQ